MVRRPKKSKYFPTRSGTVSSAVSDAISDLTELGGECKEAKENMPENLQNSSRAEMLETAGDTLEGISEPDCPEHLQDLPCSWTEDCRKGTGRPVRRDNCVSMIDAAMSAVQSWMDENEDSEDDEVKEQHEAASSYHDELDNAKAEAEGVEFPGMYG